MQKTKLITTIVIAVLLLSIITPLIQFSNANDDASTKPNHPNTTLVQHKMSAAELQAYRDSAGTYQQDQNYNKIVAGYGTGLHPPTEEGWTEIAENAYIVEKISYQTTLPAAVDHTMDPWFPPIGDQGQQGSCASFAVGYYCKTYQEAKEHSWNLSGATWTGGFADGNVSAGYQSMIMSPAFVYDLINGGGDVGSDFETPIRLVSSVGICSWEKMPYYWQDFTRWPTEEAWSEAPLYRSNSSYSYQYLYVNTTQGVESLKNWLAAGNLAIIGIDASGNLLDFPATSNQDLFNTDNYVTGELDHAATIVGYDDLYTYMENGAVQHGAFKIANSWGKGGWETIPDGCYWISYNTMLQLSALEVNPAVLFENLADYQPEILATFNATHETRGDCNITLGLGTPEAPIVTKNFTDYISGGNRSFCPNNIVFDLTEFKNNLTSQYNQPFFMQIYDKGIDSNGNADTGTINYFAIANTSSPQTPVATVNGQYINLTLIHSFAPTSLNVSPSSGPPSGEVTLNGVGFRDNSVDISYYNPITNEWTPITTNYAISPNFAYTLHAPDLHQTNPAGDNSPGYDSIVFRVQDDDNAYTTSYSEYRSGLIQVDNQTATGLFGNGTDLATKVFVQNGQSLTLAGKWFSPGTATILWANTNIGTSTIDTTGLFNTTVTVPTTTAGQHTLTVDDGASNVSVAVTRLPTVTDNYTDIWRTNDFTINLTPDYPVSETYYRINNGQTHAVSINGQPIIATEGTNTIEYWSTWSVYRKGNMELNHTTLTGIKLDKTPPTASMQINGGSTTTTSNTVLLALDGADSASGIKQVRFSNDGTWNQAVWEQFTNGKTWQLTSGAGTKTVYYQIKDNAGLTTTVTTSIVLSTPQATATPSPTATPTPPVPEYSTPLFILLLAILTASMLITLKVKSNRGQKVSLD